MSFADCDSYDPTAIFRFAPFSYESYREAERVLALGYAEKARLDQRMAALRFAITGLRRLREQDERSRG